MSSVAYHDGAVKAGLEETKDFGKLFGSLQQTVMGFNSRMHQYQNCLNMLEQRTHDLVCAVALLQELEPSIQDPDLKIKTQTLLRGTCDRLQ